MIARLGSLLLLLYALGFVFFTFTLGRPATATAKSTDAAVVLTGGKGRIEHAIDALAGSVAGAIAAALVLLLLASGASFAGELAGGALLRGPDLILLLLFPLALTILATMVARMAVLAALREAL